MIKTIKTERLEIKPYSEKDRAQLVELLMNDDIKKTFMIPDFKTKEELHNMINKIEQYALSEDHFERGIYKNDCLIGFVNDVEIDNNTIELGYVIHPSYHNHGYATEMLRAVIDELLSNGFSTVIAGAFSENTASIRVMQKCGMKKLDKEDDIIYRGIKRQCVYYATKLANSIKDEETMNIY